MTQHTTDRKLFHKMLPWIICGIGTLFYCYEYFLRVTPSVMQQQLMTTFNINNAVFGALAALYYNAYTPMQLPVGLLMDRYGPRRLLTFACLVCVLGTYLFSIHVFTIAGIGRFLVGAGSAFAFVGVLKLATNWLPPQRFAMIAGLVTGVGMFGPMLGDVLLSPMSAKFGWHQTVIFTAILGVLLSVILWVFIRDRNYRQSPQEQHLTGQSQTISFADLFKGLWEMLCSRQVWLAGIIGCGLYLPISVFAELWGIPYLEQAQHFPAMHAALVNPLIFLGFALGGTMIGWISDMIKRRREPMIVGGILTLITVCVLLYFSELSVAAICFLLFLLGFFAGVEVIVFAVSRESVRNRSAGTAIAVTNFLLMLGGMVFQPVIGMMLDKHATMAGHSLTALDNSDYRYALIVVPISIAVSVVLAFFIKETAATTLEMKEAHAQALKQGASS